jgi:mycothiol synthase
MSGEPGLTIRPYVSGPDDALWTDITNQACAEYPEVTPDTLADFALHKQGPWFDPAGMMVAELGGRPVGVADAYVDHKAVEEHGYMDGLAVLPEFRRRGVGTALAQAVMDSLRARGRTKARCWLRGQPGPVAFAERLGMRRVRIFNRMAHDLKTLPHDVGESRTAEVVEAGPTEDTMLVVNRLDNESFAEHFNFRPMSIDETRHIYDAALKRGEWLFTIFARIAGEPVGYVLGGTDPSEVKHRQTNVGWLYGLGVLKPFRNQGIGKTLLITGLSRLKAHGMTEAELGVDTENVTGALHLYERLGFAVVRRHFTYEKNLTE